jgi:hypothetical protein
MGLTLPTAVHGSGGAIIMPACLHDNIQSGFAHWLPTWPNDPTVLRTAIETAINQSRDTPKIRNDRSKMERNLYCSPEGVDMLESEWSGRSPLSWRDPR